MRLHTHTTWPAGDLVDSRMQALLRKHTGVRVGGKAAAARLPPPAALILRPTGSGATDHLEDGGVEPVGLTGVFVLGDGKHSVGRSDGSEVYLPYITVSGKHAVIFVEGDKASVTDLRSTNGTQVDGQDVAAMETVALASGSDVVFGDANLARYSVEIVSDEALLPEAEPAVPAAE